MNDAFPHYPANRGMWITAVLVDDVNSSPDAFYRAGLLVVAQARAMLELSGRTYNTARANLRERRQTRRRSC